MIVSAISVPVVAIVGGGFTGAAVAYHLARLLPEGTARIVVYEPRAMLGGGLAYDTDEPVHRINVPAARMTLLPGDDTHFERWLFATGALADDREAVTEDGRVFARRSAFGRYVDAMLRPLVAAGRIEHRRRRVHAVTTEPGGWRVVAEDGSVLKADCVVVATTHPSPQAPAVLDRALAGHPAYIPDATVPGTLAGISRKDRVLVVGTGLTAADVITALDAAGHEGPITAVSRRGLRSRGHTLLPKEPFGDFTTSPARSARELLRRVRRTLEQAAGEGITWHAVFDRLRGEGGAIWRALPTAERRRLVRHLRPYWDVHRFRIAPQVEAVIDSRLSAGSLHIHAASLLGAVLREDGTIAVAFRPRRGGQPFEEHYDAVVVTTGPGHRAILSSQPFLETLAAAGVLQLDTVGLGLAVDDDSRAVRTNGEAAETLFIAGPLARGTFGELMGLPQVTEHALLVSENIVRALASAREQSRVTG